MTESKILTYEINDDDGAFLIKGGDGDIIAFDEKDAKRIVDQATALKKRDDDYMGMMKAYTKADFELKAAEERVETLENRLIHIQLYFDNERVTGDISDEIKL